MHGLYCCGRRDRFADPDIVKGIGFLSDHAETTRLSKKSRGLYRDPQERRTFS